jgi:hypothetical protein
MCTTLAAPGAIIFLLNWPTTDVNITTRSGVSFLALLRLAITDLLPLPANPNQVQHQFLLQQWRDIEMMLVEKSP